MGLAEQYLGVDHAITTTVRNSYLAAKRTISTKPLASKQRVGSAANDRAASKSPGKAPVRLIASPRAGSGSLPPSSLSLRLPSPLAKDKPWRSGNDVPTPRTIVADVLARGATLPPLDTSASPLKARAGLSPRDPFFSPRFRFESNDARTLPSSSPASSKAKGPKPKQRKEVTFQDDAPSLQSNNVTSDPVLTSESNDAATSDAGACLSLTSQVNDQSAAVTETVEIAEATATTEDAASLALTEMPIVEGSSDHALAVDDSDAVQQVSGADEEAPLPAESLQHECVDGSVSYSPPEAETTDCGGSAVHSDRQANALESAPVEAAASESDMETVSTPLDDPVTAFEGAEQSEAPSADDDEDSSRPDAAPVVYANDVSECDTSAQDAEAALDQTNASAEEPNELFDVSLSEFAVDEAAESVPVHDVDEAFAPELVDEVECAALVVDETDRHDTASLEAPEECGLSDHCVAESDPDSAVEALELLPEDQPYEAEDDGDATTQDIESGREVGIFDVNDAHIAETYEWESETAAYAHDDAYAYAHVGSGAADDAYVETYDPESALSQQPTAEAEVVSSDDAYDPSAFVHDDDSASAALAHDSEGSSTEFGSGDAAPDPASVDTLTNNGHSDDSNA